MTFEVPQAFEVSTHLSTVAPTMLLFFVASKRTEILEVTFSSDVLLPIKQVHLRAFFLLVFMSVCRNVVCVLRCGAFKDSV